MNWNEFFEKTRLAAGVDSYAKLAPLLGISDGAIAHYRQGRRVPQVWIVADALKIQGHPEPEKSAIQIMKAAALTAEERKFWKKLAATAAMLALFVPLALPVRASNGPQIETGGMPSFSYKQHRLFIMSKADYAFLTFALLLLRPKGCRCR